MPIYAITRVRHGDPDGKVTEYQPGEELSGMPDAIMRELIEGGSAVSVTRAVTVPPGMTRAEMEAQVAALSTQLALMPVGTGNPDDSTVKRDQIIAAAAQQQPAEPPPPPPVDTSTPKGK
jgi:hypothetical protein